MDIETIKQQTYELIDRLKKLSDISKAYNSFSGIGNGMEGKVRFIYTIDGIDNE